MRRLGWPAPSFQAMTFSRVTEPPAHPLYVNGSSLTVSPGIAANCAWIQSRAPPIALEPAVSSEHVLRLLNPDSLATLAERFAACTWPIIVMMPGSSAGADFELASLAVADSGLVASVIAASDVAALDVAASVVRASA